MFDAHTHILTSDPFKGGFQRALLEAGSLLLQAHDPHTKQRHDMNPATSHHLQSEMCHPASFQSTCCTILHVSGDLALRQRPPDTQQVGLHYTGTYSPQTSSQICSSGQTLARKHFFNDVVRWCTANVCSLCQFKIQVQSIVAVLQLQP